MDVPSLDEIFVCNGLFLDQLELAKFFKSGGVKPDLVLKLEASEDPFLFKLLLSRVDWCQNAPCKVDGQQRNLVEGIILTQMTAMEDQLQQERVCLQVG